jgi:hypothetical protein
MSALCLTCTPTPQVWPQASSAQQQAQLARYQQPQQQAQQQQGRMQPAAGPIQQPAAPNGLIRNVARRQLEDLHSMVAERQVCPFFLCFLD